MMVKKLFIIILLSSLISCGGGGDSPGTSPVGSSSTSEWSIDTNFVADGGPGKDGIPSLDQPGFINSNEVTYMFPEDLIVGVKIGNQIKGYPHKILDWHEVVNDSLDDDNFVLSYCPLTGSAMVWNINNDTGNTEFGVSGLLYNSNLILYDRSTDSNWPQMLMESARGSKKGTIASQKTLFETTWQNFTEMYPDAKILDVNTGFSRNYFDYPYGSFRTDTSLFFNVNNQDDARLHKKQRVLGIKEGSSTKAYVIANLAGDLEIINDTIGAKAIVVAGSANNRFAVAFERMTADGTVLDFSAEFNQLPIVMSDSEGNLWDINGVALSGPRTGEQLKQPFSYIVYWFAWASFFPETSIYQ